MVEDGASSAPTLPRVMRSVFLHPPPCKTLHVTTSEEPVQDGAQLLVIRKTYICANFWLCCPFQDLIQDEDQRVLPGHRVPETLRDPR